MLVAREVYEEALDRLSEVADGAAAPSGLRRRPARRRRPFRPSFPRSWDPCRPPSRPSTRSRRIRSMIVPSPTVPPPPDRDRDGVPDGDDNCPEHPNPDQADTGRRRAGDACDPVEPDRDDGSPTPPTTAVTSQRGPSRQRRRRHRRCVRQVPRVPATTSMGTATMRSRRVIRIPMRQVPGDQQRRRRERARHCPTHHR